MEGSLLYEGGEEILYFIEILHVEEFEFFGRGFENPGDRLIVEQEVDPIHTLGEEMLNLVEMGVTDAKLFHT
ncbi:MAG: hypothetical protein KF799_10210 [Bdellovibrionales bacterium]|nr:hypothetical protein [Bdellovibrionales bacterium]